MVAEAPGSARLLLAPNVVHLAPESAVFTAMKEGWARQQHARFLKASTIEPRLRLINRFEVFTGLYPWQWTPADGEAFIAHLRSGANPRSRPCSTRPMPGRPRSADTGERGR